MLFKGGPCLSKVTQTNTIRSRDHPPMQDIVRRGCTNSGIIDVMPLFLLFDRSGDEIKQVLARRSLTQKPLDVVLDSRKQTRAQHSIRSQPDPAAMTAEGLRHRD
jgi:hypothetical protein